MIHGLELRDVIDRGVPNLERIPLYATFDVTLGNYWLGLGLKQSQESIFPINDSLFWLGNGYLEKGDWLFVYSGTGIPTTHEMPNQSNKISTLHWNKGQTLFHSAEIYPYLIAGDIRFPPSFSQENPGLPIY